MSLETGKTITEFVLAAVACVLLAILLNQHMLQDPTEAAPVPFAREAKPAAPLQLDAGEWEMAWGAESSFLPMKLAKGPAEAEPTDRLRKRLNTLEGRYDWQGFHGAWGWDAQTRTFSICESHGGNGSWQEWSGKFDAKGCGTMSNPDYADGAQFAVKIRRKVKKAK